MCVSHLSTCSTTVSTHVQIYSFMLVSVIWCAFHHRQHHCFCTSMSMFLIHISVCHHTWVCLVSSQATPLFLQTYIYVVIHISVCHLMCVSFITGNTTVSAHVCMQSHRSVRHLICCGSSWAVCVSSQTAQLRHLIWHTHHLIWHTHHLIWYTHHLIWHTHHLIWHTHMCVSSQTAQLLPQTYIYVHTY